MSHCGGTHHIERTRKSMVPHPGDSTSLTTFKKNTHELTEQMKETGRPLVLTINGQAELVVQDLATYERMTTAVQRAERLARARRSVDELRHSGGRPLAAVLAELRRLRRAK
jgi:PHD/YefM family antitoxin component YafN of YafNO toxin-antitoxin module